MLTCHRQTTNRCLDGVVVITNAKLYYKNPVLRFCAGSNSADGMLEIRDDEDLCQWSRQPTINQFSLSMAWGQEN